MNASSPERLPEHGSCFVCGSANPAGIGLVFHYDGEKAWADVTFGRAQQGPPGHAHGGSLAAVLDETMAWAIWRRGYPVVAARLEIDYRQPTPLGVLLRVEGELLETGRRSVQGVGRILLPDGSVSVEARGVFAAIDGALAERLGGLDALPRSEDGGYYMPPSAD